VARVASAAPMATQMSPDAFFVFAYLLSATWPRFCGGNELAEDGKQQRRQRNVCS